MKNMSENELEIRFFAAGELLLYVEQVAELSSDEVRRALMEHPVLQSLESEPLMQALKESQISTLAFPPRYGAQRLATASRSGQSQPSGRYWSLATLRLHEQVADMDDKQLAGLVVRLDERIAAYDGRSPTREDYLAALSTGSLESKGQRDRIRWESLRKAPKRRPGKTSSEGQEDEPVELKGATLNWLMAGTPGQVGVGGPGSIPTPALTRDLGAGAEQFSVNGSSIDELLIELESRPCRGDGARVFILDTAHSRDDFDKIYDTLVGDGHPLLKTLMTAPGAGTDQRFHFGDGFEVWRSDLLDPVDGADYETPCHPYDPSDHGLFVAGIVHTVAPEAAITLVEVLNGQAVGTMQSIIDGFAKVMEALPGEKRPAVINCSFMLATPEAAYHAQTEDGDCQPEHARDTFDDWSTWVTDNPWQVILPKRLLDWMSNLLTEVGVSFVAAAGNEGVKGTHPPARYPAASKSAVGVGAIQADGSSTPYSNLADSPLVDGFQALGGMRDAQTLRAINDPAAPERGILGIFTRPFPGANPGDEIPNQNGWGYWAGTSFATPIVAGLLARLRGCGKGHDVSIALLRKLPPYEQPDKPGQLKIKQGR